jgi:lipopolysaccharide biosynthesis regulator YciM
MTRDEAIEKLIELAYEYFDELDFEFAFENRSRDELDKAARIARNK